MHYFNPDRFFNTMGQHPPTLRVRPGDTVIMQTLDALESIARERNGESRPTLKVVLSGWRARCPATRSK